MPRVDTLIVGGGLAGALLAWRLMKTGRSALVCDGGIPGAFQVAAGLASPVTGQRATLLPKASAVLAEARATYATLAEDLGRNFWREREILRVFANAGEAARWHARAATAPFAPYLCESPPAAAPELSSLHAPFGSLLIRQAGHLDMAGLVQALRKWLRERGAWRDAQVNAADVQVEGPGVRWDDVHASTLVFCEGAAGRGNPHFPSLKFQPTRGELIEVEVDGLNTERVLYGEHFLIPLGGGRWLCGATYDRVNLGAGVTEAGRHELEQGLSRLLSLPFRVRGQRVGLRPNVRGHQATLLRHAQHPQLSLFNGLGSKGALWAPCYSAVLANELATATAS